MYIKLRISTVFFKMQKRQVLWWLLTFQMICNTFVTLNINIAIVSMVKTPDSVGQHNEASVVCPNTTFFSRDIANDAPKSSPTSKNTGYEWSEAEQNVVLSGYYWLNYFSILPGGILAQKFGSKHVVGFAQTTSSIMSSLIPIFADYGPVTVSWIRAMQGVLSFMSVPAGMFTIIGNWCPPHERGWFGALFLVGSSFGLALGSFCFGYVAQYFHWKLVFHLTSACGLIWAVFWYTLVHDRPRDHPSISFEEREYIENSLKKSTANNKNSIPWKSIITSIPVIVTIFATNSGIWLFVMLTTYSPIYLKTMYGLNSNEIGIITSIPQFFNGLASLAIGYYCDVCIKKGLISMTNIRKLCVLIGPIIASFPLIAIAFTKCNITVVVFCLLLCCVVKSFGNFGSPLVVVDMSPKFCGILEGFSGTSSSIQTFLFSAAVNYFTGIWEIEKLWKYVFLFTALYSIIPNIIFLIYGTAKVQEWNFRKTISSTSEEKSLDTDVMEKHPIIVKA